MDARTATRRHTKWKLTPPEDMTAEQRRVRAETKVADALAQIVYDRRTELGWTKAELARRADMDVRMITRIEDGARPPTTPTLLRVAEALGGRITVDHDGDQSTVTFHAHESTNERPTPAHGDFVLVFPKRGIKWHTAKGTKPDLLVFDVKKSLTRGHGRTSAPARKSTDA
ncbi:helix-turn-helix domain-containing protein [Embleya sp. NPDC050493]|uniref:helix-turn-helix domain-containing protein n=1 Tax=Embleya sp. NPDC050493 TaxID=3363989 RepID=UPI0037948BDC